MLQEAEFSPAAPESMLITRAALRRDLDGSLSSVISSPTSNKDTLTGRAAGAEGFLPPSVSRCVRSRSRTHHLTSV